MPGKLVLQKKSECVLTCLVIYFLIKNTYLLT
jgi:hypothetical protein